MAPLRLAIPVVALVVVAACSAPVVRPQLAYVTARGCGEFIVYARNAERTEFLIVHVDRKKLGISVGESRTFDIASHRDSINVRIALHPQEAFGDCNHKDRSAEKPELWRATAGAVYRITDAVAVEEQEDEGLSYYLLLDDGRTLFLSGQYLWEPAEHGFPWESFEVVRVASGDWVLRVEPFGPPVTPSGTRRPFSWEELSSTDLPADGTIEARDFDALRTPAV